MVEKEGTDYWAEWIKGTAEDRPLARPWTQLTNEQIDELARKAYCSYYFSPGQLLRSIAIVRSFKEFKRKFLAAYDMLFHQEKYSTQDDRFRAYNENRSMVSGKVKMPCAR